MRARSSKMSGPGIFGYRPWTDGPLTMIKLLKSRSALIVAGLAISLTGCASGFMDDCDSSFAANIRHADGEPQELAFEQAAFQSASEAIVRAQSPEGPELIPQGSLAPLPPSQPLIVDVRIVGNKKVREDKIHSYIKTRRDREFDQQQMLADTRKLMSSGLFKSVKPVVGTVPEGMVVTFEVIERPTMDYVRFIGNKGIQDKKLLSEAGLKKGDPLNQYAIDEGRRKVEEFYHSRGYAKAQVTIIEGIGPNDRGVVYDIAEGHMICIEKVEFIGNTIADDSRLATQIESKPGKLKYIFRGKLDFEKLDADEEKLLAYYRSLGFFKARLGRELKISESGKWATLIFVVDEGPRYVVRNVTVGGNQVFGSPDLLGRLESTSGDFFNQAKMHRDVEQLGDIYGGQGYIFANIKADPVFDLQPGQLDLAYNIEEGEQFRAGKIYVDIGGEYPHTRDTVVLNRLSITPGEVIDMRKVRASESRLKASQLFEDEQSGGQPPRISIRPPELGGLVGSSPKSKPRTTRGQSPND